MSDLKRFFSFTERRGKCLEWTGYRDKDGYGRFRLGKEKARANRARWELSRGPIPPGVLVLHRCDNTSCVDLRHLYLGDHAQNTRDTWGRGRAMGTKIYLQSIQTHCIHGHKFTTTNTYTWKGHRRCKTCHRNRMRGYGK